MSRLTGPVPHRNAIAPLALLGWAAPLVVLAASCSPVDRPSWRDQLVADSPCYRVDLLDGLNEDDPAETRDLFDCLDHHGHLESLRPTVEALQPPSSDGASGLVEVARAVNALPDAGVDLSRTVEVGIALLRDPGEPLTGLLDLWLELSTGAPARSVRSGAVDTTDPQVLRSGVLAPLAPVLPVAATDLLSDDMALVTAFGTALRGPTSHAIVYTVAAMARSPHPDVQAVVTGLPEHAGELIEATQDGSDGLWSGGGDDSLRDLVTVMVGDERHDAAMTALAPPLTAILQDDRSRSRLGGVLRRLHAEGSLDSVASDLGWLASVNVDGDPAQRGEVSGVEALVRLLDGANRPMVCTLDLGITDVSVNLGNLSVSLLGLIAELDPNTVQSGAGILGDLIDGRLSQTLLTTLANTGVCPTLTSTLVEDLQVLDLLFDDNADSLVRAFLGVTKALKTDGHLDDMVDAASVLWQTDAIWALGDVVRDTADERLWDDAVAMVPILLDPAAYGLPADSFAFDDAWELLSGAVSDPELGWAVTAPVVQHAATADGTWQAMTALGVLLRDRRSQTSDVLVLVDAWTTADPDLTLLDTGAALLADPSIAGPVLRMAAMPGVAASLLAPAPEPGQQAVPLAFGARLVTEGSIDDLLSLMDRLITGLEGSP